MLLTTSKSERETFLTFWVFYSLGFGPFEHHIYIHENDNKSSYSHGRRIITIDKLIESDKNSNDRNKKNMSSPIYKQQSYTQIKH